MSDALTNSEIEDVLTSVRRLVADDARHAAAGREEAGRPGGRLILTQAQRIDATSTVEPGTAGSGTEERSGKDGPKAVAPISADPRVVSVPEPLTHTPLTQTPLTQEPDFRRLEATIAELEAAVSASGSVFEPDGSETAPASNVTALYAKPSFLHSAPPDPATPRADAATTAPVPPVATPDTTRAGTQDNEADDPDDDELFETVIDEATLRTLVAQIVREELQGQLGERITLQVRKLVRSEIAKVLDSRDLI